MNPFKGRIFLVFSVIIFLLMAAGIGAWLGLRDTQPSGLSSQSQPPSEGVLIWQGQMIEAGDYDEQPPQGFLEMMDEGVVPKELESLSFEERVKYFYSRKQHGPYSKTATQ